jgi:hypothetical protein
VSGPAWIVDSFVAVVLITSAYTVARLLAAPLWGRFMHYDVNVAHIAMGAAMVGMLAPALRFGSVHVWEVLFAVLTLWFLWQGGRLVTTRGLNGLDDDGAHHVSHYFAHFVMAAAMLFMFWAGMYDAGGIKGPVGFWTAYAPASGGGPADYSMIGGYNSHSVFAGLFLLVLMLSAVWQVDGMYRFGRRLAPAPAATPAVALVAARGSGDEGTGEAGAGPATTAAAATEAASRAEGGSDGAEVRQPRLLLAPRLETLCHVVMCVAMGYMVVSLL